MNRSRNVFRSRGIMVSVAGARHAGATAHRQNHHASHHASHQAGHHDAKASVTFCVDREVSWWELEDREFVAEDDRIRVGRMVCATACCCILTCRCSRVCVCVCVCVCEHVSVRATPHARLSHVREFRINQQTYRYTPHCVHLKRV